MTLLTRPSITDTQEVGLGLLKSLSKELSSLLKRGLRLHKADNLRLCAGGGSRVDTNTITLRLAGMSRRIVTTSKIDDVLLEHGGLPYVLPLPVHLPLQREKDAIIFVQSGLRL